MIIYCCFYFYFFILHCFALHFLGNGEKVVKWKEIFISQMEYSIFADVISTHVLDKVI